MGGSKSRHPPTPPYNVQYAQMVPDILGTHKSGPIFGRRDTIRMLYWWPRYDGGLPWRESVSIEQESEQDDGLSHTD